MSLERVTDLMVSDPTSAGPAAIVQQLPGETLKSGCRPNDQTIGCRWWQKLTTEQLKLL